MSSSSSAASGTQLTIEDLSTVHDALTTVAHKFFIFGSKISVPHHILTDIAGKTNGSFDEKLYKVLEYRLKQLPLLTWHDIVRALRSPGVQYQALASEIESQYIYCSSTQSQLASGQCSPAIGPDSVTNSPAQAIQRQYFPHQPSQWHLPPSHHPLPIFSQTQMYPHPQPQIYQHSLDFSQSLFKPQLSVNPSDVLPQLPRGKILTRKRDNFEQIVVSSQASGISAQPKSFGSHSWQSQPLMAEAPSAKRYRIQPDPSLSLPYSDSGSKALFNQFIKYVKTLYQSSTVEKRPEVLKLQTPGRMFINLAFIDRKTEGLRTEYDEITEAMVRDGNVDVIEGRKCPIDMNKIAANMPKGVLEKVILVEGAPGVGKSTFAWEFCRRWGKGRIAQQYDLVLLLPLRDKNISQAKCLKDLIHHHSEKVRDAVVSELESCLGVNVLLLLEGYNELPDECRQSSLFLELINGQQLPFATLLITSRPWATCDVRRKFEHRIFQHIEVLGFTKKKIKTYIRSALSEPEALHIEEHLRKQSTVKMSMYIPLNCANIVTIYLECKATGVALPTTLSEFYVALSCAILLRYLRAANSSYEPFEFKHLNNLPATVKNKFDYLCQLAYDSITRASNQVKLIFTDLPEDFDGLGFMDSVFEFYVTQKAVASHNFLHLTFQEFLAAVHISNMEAEQRLQHFKRHKEGRLRVVLRFLAGITKLKDFNTPSAFASIFDQPRKCGYTAIDYTIRPHVCTWVYEALGKGIIRRTFNEGMTMEFDGENLSDSAALGYCITHSHCKWVLSVSGRMGNKDIDILVDESQASDSTGGVIVGLRGGINEGKNTFNGLNVSLKGLNRIFTGLHIELSELALELPASCNQISWPELSSLQSLTIDMWKNTNWELDYLLPQVSLSSLTIRSPTSSFSLKDNEAIANYITNTSTLKDLTVSVKYPEIGMEKIFAGVIKKEPRPIFTLEIMAEDAIGDKYAESLANYIRATALSKLFFTHLEFSAFGALQVANALRDVPDLIADKLCFVVRKQGDFPCALKLINDFSDLLHEEMQEFVECGVEFSFLLPDSTTVKRGFNVYCYEGIDVGVQHVVEAIHNYSLVKGLRLFRINAGDVGAKVLAEALNCNTILEELDLTGNKIGSVGMEALGHAVGSNSALKKLVLSENATCDVGAKAFAEVLSCNTILEELHLSENEISSVGAKALAQAIGSNSTLKKLVLSFNDISDVGAIAVAEGLNCNTILEELDLSDNKISSVGAEALAEAIGSNTVLKKLDLSGNDVGDIGAKALAVVLNCNTVLEELNLSDTKIGIVGTEVLAHAIGSNTALKNLDLYNNDVGDVGAVALAQALYFNTSLEQLYLSHTKIGDCGAEALAKALYSNYTLKHLDLRLNSWISESGIHFLIQALTVNTSVAYDKDKNLTGLVLDKETHEEYALNCSQYESVKSKIIFDVDNLPPFSQYSNVSVLQKHVELEETMIYVGKACSYTSQSGISLHFPDAKCPTPVKVSVKVVSGDYTLPPEYEGRPLVSSMFKITASDELPAPITVQIEHCAVVDKEDCLVHMIAHDPLPYQFKPLPGGKFLIMGSYGEIQLKKFSTLTTICRMLGLYMNLSVFVFYHRDNTATFVATRNLSEAIEAVKEWFDKAIECFEQSMIYYCYTTREITLTIPEATKGRWSIVPKCKPPKIERELIFKYKKGQQPPSIQLKMKWTSEGPPEEEDIEVKLTGCSIESFTLTCMSPDKRLSQSQKQTPSTTNSTTKNWITQKAESRALQKSNEIFIKGACPDSLLAALYGRGLLTSDENEKAMQQSLTDGEKLQEIFKALKRRVSINPEHFKTLLQILQNEPATEEVAESMKAIYEEECRKKQ